MGSGIIYYRIEKLEKYEDSNDRADSDLAVVKTRRYHFDDEPFIHPLHSIRFDLDHPYELPVESFLALRHRDPSKKKDSAPQESGPSRTASLTPQYSPLGPIIRLGPPSSPTKTVPLPKFNKGDDVEGKKATELVLEWVDDIKGIEEEEEKNKEEEEDPEEDVSEKVMTAIPRLMDEDADEDYLVYLEELQRHPEYSPIHSSQAFDQHPSDDAQSQSSDARSQPSFDLSGVWPPLVGPS
ncbi:hypothetical protein PIB30_084779 [Stylosanthes scabra]|uniref:Uncharacterized protein n=1 Tax=Stylosanthes scabra TaxID=79078 RepID=A0ABU6ZR84_9FABA|nr:hypothetical protein [Stylosanthes scabra]